MIAANKLFVTSEITGKPSLCTIQTGIELPSGERIGAHADIDALAMFSIDCRIAIRNINQNEGLNLKVPKREVLLWEMLGIENDKCSKRRRGRVSAHDTSKAKVADDVSKLSSEERVKLYMKRFEMGEQITSDKMLEEIEGSAAVDDAYQSFIASNGIDLS